MYTVRRSLDRLIEYIAHGLAHRSREKTGCRMTPSFGTTWIVVLALILCCSRGLGADIGLEHGSCIISTRDQGTSYIVGSDISDDWGSEPTEATQKNEPVISQIPQKTTPKQPSQQPPPIQWERTSWRQLKVEIAMIALIVIYFVNIFLGRRENDKIAKAFAQTFCSPGGVFDKNFTMVGIGGDAQVPLIKESAAQYKLYCSGRRHCKSLQAIIKLRERQDIFNSVLGLVFPSEDKVEIDVYMKEGSMPQTVIAVATKKIMRIMLQEETGEDDVRKLTRKLDVKIPGWPSEKLIVHGEHSSVFQDLVTEQLLDQVFRKPAFDTQGKYFRFLHFTPDQSYGPKEQKAVLRFSFALPPRSNMQAITKLMSSVGVFIDLMGNFKLSPELQKRAEKIRQDLDTKNDDKIKEREDHVEGLRNAKRLEEADKLKRMTPEQREKYKEKKEKIQQKRDQRRYVRRM